MDTIEHPLRKKLEHLLEVVMLFPGGVEAARILVRLRLFIVLSTGLLLALTWFVWPALHDFLLRMAKIDAVVLGVTLAVSVAANRGSERLLRAVLLGAFLSDLALEVIGLMASGFSNGSFVVIPILTLLSAAVLIGERPAAASALFFALAYPAAALSVRAGLWPLPSDLSWVGDRARSWSQLLLFVVGQEVFLGLVIAPSVWLVGRLRLVYRDYHQRHATAVERIATEVQKRRAERSAAEQVLRQRERSYQLLADNVTDMVTLCTPALEFTFVSPSATRVVGYSPEELLGRRLRDLVHPDDLALVTSALAEHQREGDGEAELLCEFRVRHRDGQWRWLETRGRTLVAEPGDVPGVVLSSRDIGQRRALEATMLQAQKLESLGLLVGGIAHDFNNILTSIIGNADLVTRALPPQSKLLAPLDRIARAGARAAELCKQMMTYAGSGTAALAPVDINEVIRDIPALLGAAVPAEAVLAYDLDESVPLVEGDAAQLRQVAMNLVLNAAEALGGRPGHVTVTSGMMTFDDEVPPAPEQHRVQPLAAASGVEYVYVSVTDSGCGMDQATLERIFDPFFTTKFAGRGLGLSALLGIVRAHRGFVTVTTRSGGGTVFTVGFPPSARRAGEPRKGNGDGAWRGSGRVLVVDDEGDVLEVVGDMLTTMGFEVLAAAEGEPGVELFRRHADDIAFVMCDVAMPRMGGAELVRAIRAIRPSARVALMSGFDRGEMERRFADLEADGVLQKPFTMESLRTMAQALARELPADKSRGGS